MKKEATIREASESVDESTAEDGCTLDWAGDNFKHGFLIEKLVALGFRANAIMPRFGSNRE